MQWDIDFSICSILGSGHHGDVWFAQRLPDKPPIAVKILKADHAICMDDCCKGHMPLEACMLQKCQGIKGVVKMFGVSQTGLKKQVILMEYSRNDMDLFKLIQRNGCLEEALVKSIFSQVIRIVIEMKYRNVVHGDIRDENVLIDPTTGYITLIDFGMAHKTENLPSEKTVGTKVYMPPEFFTRHSCHWDPRTVWSLGCFLYVLIHAKEPFLSSEETINKPIEIEKAISDDCKDLMFGMLQRDEHKRLTLNGVSNHPWVSIRERV